MLLWSLAAAAILHASAPPTAPLSALQVGQRGECHTVFVGDTVERVPFEVRGIMPGFLGPRRDLLLIRLLGDKAEFSGVASGMSGSPCHVDGKLVGALSYSFAHFGKEPVAGVTPIDDMLALWKLPPEPLPWRTGEPAAARRSAVEPTATAALPPMVAEALATLPAADDDWQAFRSGRPSPRRPSLPEGARPLAVPLSVSGLSAARAGAFAPYWASHGLDVMPGAGASRAGTPRGTQAAPLVPGGSVAAVLVHGDVDVAGTGTVSYVDGDRVLAFGHPFFGVGPISTPMAQAHILQILASSQHSRKMPVTGALVGEFTQDRLSAIAGAIGPSPNMVSVKGRVHGPLGSEPFSFSVVRDGFFTPRFLATALISVLDGRLSKSDRGSVSVESTLSFAGERPLRLAFTKSAERDPDLVLAPAADVSEAFSALWDSHASWPGEATVELDVTYRPEARERRLKGMRPSRTIAAPGERVPVVIELEAREQAPETLAFEVAVPPLPDGEPLLVVACEGAVADALDDATLGQPALEQRGQWQRWLATRRTPGELYVQLRRLHGHAQVGSGQRLVNLPPSASLSLGLESHGEPAATTPVPFAGGEPHFALSGAVRGCALAKMVVRRPVAGGRHAKH